MGSYACVILNGNDLGLGAAIGPEVLAGVGAGVRAGVGM